MISFLIAVFESDTEGNEWVTRDWGEVKEGEEGEEGEEDEEDEAGGLTLIDW